MISKEIDDFLPIIEHCYSQDEEELLKIWHRADEKNYKDMAKNAEEDLRMSPHFTFCAIYDGANLVGYFGKESLEHVVSMPTFFICPEYRPKKKEVFDFIKSNMPSTFFAGIHSCNGRAKRFFEKHGGKLVMIQERDGYTGYIYKFEEIR